MWAGIAQAVQEQWGCHGTGSAGSHGQCGQCQSWPQKCCHPDLEQIPEILVSARAEGGTCWHTGCAGTATPCPHFLVTLI